MSRKLLVIGASGLLGSSLMARAGRKYDVVGTCNPAADGKDLWRLDSLDIGSKDEVDAIFRKSSPDLVVLAAAMTNVDACERNRIVADRVNGAGPALVARACKAMGVRLVHVSADHVFDGTKTRRYVETDMTRPISVYGSSKLAGERAVLSTVPGAAVVRTSMLYGWNPIENRENLVTSTLKRLRAGESVAMPQNRRVSPTFADDLASALLTIAESDASGIYHVAGPDCLDSAECGMIMADVFGLDRALVVPVKSESRPLPARRPAFSCLDSTKAEAILGRRMMSFEDGLRAMKEQEGSRKR